MNFPEFHYKFLDFEEKNRLFDIRINGIPVWELYRDNVYYSLRAQYVFKEDLQKKNLSLRLLIIAVVNIFKSIFHLSRLKKVDGIVFCDPGKRKLDGHFVDIYTNFIFNNTEQNWLSAERSLSFDHKNPMAVSTYFYLDFIEFLVKILGYISRFWTIRSKERIKIESIENLINIYWDVDLHLYNNLKGLVFSYKYLYKVCNKIISLTSPRVLVFVQYYTIINRLFVKIAKEKDVVTIELQHGYCGEYHINYSFGNESELNFFPDIFYAWGPFWLRNSTLFNHTKIDFTGFPFHDEARKFCEKDFRTNTNVLVLSQCRSDLADLVCRLSEQYPFISFTYKLHPSEKVLHKNILNQMALRENVNILNDDNIYSLYKFFSSHSFVMSTGSTGLIEALQFGCKILIPKLEGWQYFKSLYDQTVDTHDKIFFFEGLDDFIDGFESFDRPSSRRTNYFFNLNSRATIADKLKNIVQSRTLS
jgi:hypothetical protein